MITMTHDEHLWHLENVKRIAALEAENQRLEDLNEQITHELNNADNRVAELENLVVALAEKEGE